MVKTSGYSVSELDYDEIDFVELWSILWKNKIKVVLIALISGVLAATYAFSIPNLYKAEAVFAPAPDLIGKSGSWIPGQLGGLASLAGLDIGGGRTNKVSISVELLKSWSFIEEFIRSNGFEEEILAAKYWDENTNELVFDEKIYDSQTKTWQVEDLNQNNQPSSWLLYKAFIKKIEVKENKSTGFVLVSVDHVSPGVAKRILDALIDHVNTYMRERDVSESEKNIAYLNNKISETSIAEMRSVFYEMIEAQTKTLMLASVSDEYVLKTVSAAMVPEEKSSPRRSMLILVATCLGLMLGAIAILAWGVAAKGVGKNPAV